MKRDPRLPFLVVAALLGVLVLGVVVFALFGRGGRTSPGPTAVPAASGRIDYGVRVLGASRDDAGRYTIRIEVRKKDSWHWQAISLREISITGQAPAKANAELVSPLPVDPVPECFQLEFLSEEIQGDASDLRLTLGIAIQAKRHLGLTRARSQQTHTLPLQSVDASKEDQN
ncbi:MAG: hypothetical protein JXR77_07820 [Lentisphaeria bacterium]|nr:hypothetical protein [Lentisphaeria bacterium]